jgi:hypothetical protein
MTQWSSMSDATARSDTSADVPSPDVAAFIRYCHHRHGATWPELYDEMCAVAARREFNGWDHGELAARGLAFSLQEMPRLAAWSRAIVAGGDPRAKTSPNHGAGTPRLDSRAAVA